MSKTVYYIGESFNLLCNVTIPGTVGAMRGAMAIQNYDPAGYYSFKYQQNSFGTNSNFGFEVYKFNPGDTILGGNKADFLQRSIYQALQGSSIVYLSGLVYLYPGLNWLGLIITANSTQYATLTGWQFQMGATIGAAAAIYYYCKSGITVTIYGQS